MSIQTVEIIFDACSLINLVNGRVLDKVLTLPNTSWSIGNIVHEECTRIPFPELESEVSNGTIGLLDDSDIDAADFLDLLDLHKLGNGETECIAYASKFDYVVSTDDRKTRQVIERDLGKQKLTGSIGLLKRCVESDFLTAEEAKASYERMVVLGAFLPILDSDHFDNK